MNANFSSGYLSKIEETTPHISQERWTAITKEVCAELRPTLSDVGAIIIDVEYLRTFDLLLDEIGESELEFYMGWCVLQRMGRMIHPELAKLYHNTSEYELKVAAYADCFQLAEKFVGWSVFEPIIHETFHSLVRERIQKMLTVIQEQLIAKNNQLWSGVSGGPLLNRTDFEWAMHRDFLQREEDVANILARMYDIGQYFSTNWFLLASMRKRTGDKEFGSILSNYMDILLGNDNYSLFDRSFGAIRVPPLEVTPPVFGTELPSSVRYGALGTLLGTASFELLRSKIPARSPAAQVLAEKLRCFRGSASIPWDGQWLGRATTVDVVYKEFLKVNTHQYGIEPFSGGQTFFIAMCFLLCDGRRIGEPNLAETSCNEAAKHSEHFPAIFRCRAGKHAMNPKHKCRLF